MFTAQIAYGHTFEADPLEFAIMRGHVVAAWQAFVTLVALNIVDTFGVFLVDVLLQRRLIAKSFITKWTLW